MYFDVLNSLSGNLPTQDLKGTGLEFPWAGSSQKSCKNSKPRLGADADLKGIDILTNAAKTVTFIGAYLQKHLNIANELWKFFSE